MSDINLLDLKEDMTNEWKLEKQGPMLVPGRVFGDQVTIDHLIEDVKAGKEWNALKQLANVAALPGIQKAALAMPDVHPGYGFPIGGVGAFDLESGVISVAGVGYDINCGVRTLITPLTLDEIKPVLNQLADTLFKTVPAGLGKGGKVQISFDELDELLVDGVRFITKQGYGIQSDLTFCEEGGRVEGADPENVSEKAKKRGRGQVGTLGSGNHYLEVQVVDQIFSEEGAKAFGLKNDQIVVSIHCGSRALGHQIGTDYLEELDDASRKYNIPIREKELVSAPINSPEGEKYFSAVKCGTNAAFVNRHVIGHLTRKAFVDVIGIGEEEIQTLYDVGHNNAKIEEHVLDGEKKKLLILRKGSTRAFGSGRKEIPEKYRSVGQPVLIGGTMATNSWILHGTETAMDKTFGSANHGAGRKMSRRGAIRKFRSNEIQATMKNQGIILKAHSIKGIAEEAPGAYKDVNSIIDIVQRTGISNKVVRVLPVIVIKG